MSEREPPEWHGRDALAEHSRELATQIPALRGIDLHVGNEDRRPLDAAREIRSKALEASESSVRTDVCPLRPSVRSSSATMF